MVDNNTPEWEGRLTEADVKDMESIRPKSHFGDRKRAVLTERDRSLIFGALDLEGQQLRDAKYRIRQRIINGILDMALIGTLIEHEDMEIIVDKLDDRENIVVSEEPRHEVDNAISWIFQLLFRMQLIHSKNKGTPYLDDLEENLQAIFRTVYGPGELSVSYERFEPDERKEELATKIVTGNADIDEYNYFVLNHRPEILLDLMEEKDIDSFVVSRDKLPDYSIDKDRLESK